MVGKERCPCCKEQATEFYVCVHCHRRCCVMCLAGEWVDGIGAVPCPDCEDLED